jgi:hypothetical protein
LFHNLALTLHPLVSDSPVAGDEQGITMQVQSFLSSSIFLESSSSAISCRWLDMFGAELVFFSVECLEEMTKGELGVCLQFKQSSDDISG